MLASATAKPAGFCDGLSRRDFLRVGGLSMGLTLTELAGLQARSATREMSCIQLFLVGGPSHLETWDPKPDAPAEIRGPFGVIRTALPGVYFSEHLPGMAARADRFALLRSIYHEEAPIHETGCQLLQTGGLNPPNCERPHVGAIISHLTGPQKTIPSWVVTPRRIEGTGVNIGHGQTSGFLGSEHEPVLADMDLVGVRPQDLTSPRGLKPARQTHRSALLEAIEGVQRQAKVEEEGSRSADIAPLLLPQSHGTLFHPRTKAAFNLDAEPKWVRDRYGWNTFGQSCLLARRLVEHGVRLVTVNMFDSVFHRVTWDCHANGGDLPSTLDDYRRILCPMLDRAFCALLDDLTERGLLAHTVVVCLGEFGRSPRLNRRGGRDHWPGVWSGILAGGPIRGGQVLGASDPLGREPRERPIHPSEIVASVYHALGVDPATAIAGPDGKPYRLVEAEPIRELF
ncbi:MAG: DUF1501 domain-containing protein [Gemmatales bacterium]|nr:DUF1501 domain-containing protein [Gemmatales bacterium]MDW8388210.1 DUF1501 domain-containing protein [Gemmatales bacterium]